MGEFWFRSHRDSDWDHSGEAEETALTDKSQHEI
jgi:hypothetical protein